MDQNPVEPLALLTVADWLFVFLSWLTVWKLAVEVLLYLNDRSHGFDFLPLCAAET
jgi:hypothetical protein